MKKSLLLVSVFVCLAGFALGQSDTTSDGGTDSGGTGSGVREFVSRYLGPPQPFGLLATGGYSADFWRVAFEESVTNETTASVSREPFLLAVGGVDLYNILGYIDWNVTYRADNLDGGLDLLDGETATGVGRGNVDFESTLQVPLGYIGAGLGVLGADPEGLLWLNYLRFQWVPIDRYYRWEVELEGNQSYIDQSGAPQSTGGSVVFPARYRERRYGLVIGAWPLAEVGRRGDPEDAILAASTLELSYMGMRFTSPMQFTVEEQPSAEEPTGTTIGTRQFITDNEAGGLYARISMGDPDTYLQWFPDTWGFSVWADLFRGRTTLTSGVFELSSSTADPAAEFDNDRLVASRFGFGGGFYRQYLFGREDRARFRWGVSAFWQRYSYGPASFGSISGAFNEWETELKDDFQGRPAGEPVIVGFFREESFWGLKLEASVGF
jgi:hypothetical protein